MISCVYVNREEESVAVALSRPVNVRSFSPPRQPSEPGRAERHARFARSHANDSISVTAVLFFSFAFLLGVLLFGVFLCVICRLLSVACPRSVCQLVAL